LKKGQSYEMLRLLVAYVKLGGCFKKILLSVVTTRIAKASMY